MNRENTIFSPAEILLPVFADDSMQMQKWAVIACDQFTSEATYWDQCREIISNAPSAYRYILPEAYLGTEREEKHKNEIANNMKDFNPSAMRSLNGLIYLERTLPNGTVRHGLIGKMDLEQYDYSANSHSPIRATEATVVERIPARCAVRASAVIELPHILVLIDDRVGVFAKAAELRSSSPIIYNFDLMQGGGHVTGYHLTDANLDNMMQKISEYENVSSSVVYAMGDGNHSLAAAKAHWENLKREGVAMDDPARYALCEITALSDDSLVFEPIYRLLKNCNPNDFLESLTKVTGEGEVGQNITVVTANIEKQLRFTKETHALTVGTLQNFIDQYINEHPGVICDYIHGEDVLRKLSAEPGSIGFLMNGMDKHELFAYVDAHGTLPRKTFSMGEAASKRYYLEARKIVK